MRRPRENPDSDSDVLIEYYDDPRVTNVARDAVATSAAAAGGARDSVERAHGELVDAGQESRSPSPCEGFVEVVRGSFERVRCAAAAGDTTVLGVGVGALFWFGWQRAAQSARARARQQAPRVQHALERRLFVAMLGPELGMRYLNEQTNPALRGNSRRANLALGDDVSPFGTDSMVTPEATPMKSTMDGSSENTNFHIRAVGRQVESFGRHPSEYASAGRSARHERAEHEADMSPATPVERPRPFFRVSRPNVRPGTRVGYAFATVCSSAEYVLGAVVLASSLQRFHNGIPMICLVVSSAVDKWHREILSRAGWEVRSCSNFLSDLEWQGFLGSRDLANRDLKRYTECHRVGYMAGMRQPRKLNDPRIQWERSTFDKLSIWELTEFEKVLFLDADALVLGPLHELFQYEEMAAARSGYGLFNSGVMVIRPDPHTYQALRNCLLGEEWRSRYTRGYPFPYGDQPLLNYFFEDTFIEMPTVYNTTCQRRIRGGRTRVVHYNGMVKPWHVDRKAWFATRCFWSQQRWRFWYQEYDRALDTLRASATQLSEQCYWV
ncbi:hypothetical protein CCYA_CCYA17G4356 [Cyanidiococcus yangmingshanensis]|nr:hypothetical protein CCYA_CCYA17G4356 [Cyanidiococcus yangmingshanensis]